MSTGESGVPAAVSAEELKAIEEQRAAELRAAELKAAKRRAALQKEIERYAGKGYRVTLQTDYSAQLVKPKVFSLLWAVIWTCTVVGILIYLIWYMAKRDQQVYLTVDEDGKVHKK